MNKLFWVQEGMNGKDFNTKLFSVEIERETPKTIIVKERCKGSYGMKVINKDRIGTQFFRSALDALNAQSASLKNRVSSNHPVSDYIQGQLNNIANLLLQHGQIGFQWEILSPAMETLKKQIGELRLSDVIYDIHATAHQLDCAIKNGAVVQSKNLAMRLVWLRRRREVCKDA